MPPLPVVKGRQKGFLLVSSWERAMLKCGGCGVESDELSPVRWFCLPFEVERRMDRWGLFVCPECDVESSCVNAVWAAGSPWDEESIAVARNVRFVDGLLGRR